MITRTPPDIGGIVFDPKLWTSPGYEFWLVPGHADVFATTAATVEGLSGFGWTTTSLVLTEGSGADFLSSSDRDPTRVEANASSDALVSPPIFGSYDHALQASYFLGYYPTRLCIEFVARFATNSGNEPGSFIGFSSPSNIDITAAGGVAAVYSNGTNFVLGSDLNTDSGAAVDTNWHLFKIQIDVTNTEWWIDGASQGSFATMTDLYPCCFKAITTTTNRWGIAWVRVWYE